MKKVNVLFYVIACLLCSSFSFSACSNDEEMYDGITWEVIAEKFIDSTLVGYTGELPNDSGMVVYFETPIKGMNYFSWYNAIQIDKEKVTYVLLPEEMYNRDRYGACISLSCKYRYAYSLQTIEVRETERRPAGISHVVELFDVEYVKASSKPEGWVDESTSSNIGDGAVCGTR